MSRKILSAAFIALVIGGVVTTATYRPALAQQRICLHDPATETQAEKTRRQQALTLARAINTAESRAFSSDKRFASLEQLPITAAMPQGFMPALTTDGQRYAFSVKDTIDPCRFAYFSDQDGMIFHGQPIQ